MSISHTTDVWTVGKLLNWTREHFRKSQVDEPRLAAELLLAEAMGCRKIDLYTRFESSPTDEQRARFREMVVAAARHEPIAYLVGRKEFYSLDFGVTRDVLIPRPETETLVEQALRCRQFACQTEVVETRPGESGAGASEGGEMADSAAESQARSGDPSPSPLPKRAREQDDPAQRPIRILELGTGSGCVAVTIAKRRPSAVLTATDVSEAALAVARANAERHGVADRVSFIQADWLALPVDAAPPDGFELIVSNPPYVPAARPDALDENVRKYEPATALYGGPDGMDFYRRLSSDASAVMAADGEILVEIQAGSADAVEAIMTSGGLFVATGRYGDGRRIERVLRFGRIT